MGESSFGAGDGAFKAFAGDGRFAGFGIAVGFGKLVGDGGAVVLAVATTLGVFGSGGAMAGWTGFRAGGTTGSGASCRVGTGGSDAGEGISGDDTGGRSAVG